jgi:hypothetical protein
MAKGISVHCNLLLEGLRCENGIETPMAQNIHMNHLLTGCIGGASGTSINHIINGIGDVASPYNESSKSVD